MKRIMSVFATLAVAATAVLVIASPAQAAYYDCPNIWNNQTISGCMWEHPNATGARLHVYEVQGCKNMPWGWNDVASSGKEFDYNTAGPGYYRIWKDANCSGSSWAMQYEQGNFNSILGWPPNDAISSYAWYPS